MPDDCTVFPTWANRIRQRVGVPNPSYAKMLIRVDGLTTEAPPDWQVPACHLVDALADLPAPEPTAAIKRREVVTVSLVLAALSNFTALVGAAVDPAKTIVTLIWSQFESTASVPYAWKVELNGGGTTLIVSDPTGDGWPANGQMRFSVVEFN